MMATILAAALAAAMPSLAAASPSSAAVPADAKFSALRAEIEARVAKGEFPSLAIGVVQDGAILWEEAFGWADVQAQRKATPHTPYALASLGKSIAGTTAMTLVEAGRMSLDDSAAKHLGADAFRIYEGGAPPSVRQLLDMTSGIPHGGLTFKSGADAERYWQGDFLKRRAIVVFPPGEVFHYSNMSIGVLEAAMERADKRSYGAIAAARVFSPLGMRDAFVGDASRTARPAVAYSTKGARIVAHGIPKTSLGTFASVDDLLKFASFHVKAPLPGQKPALSDESLNEIQRARSSPNSRIALGIASIDLDDGRLWLLSDGRAGGTQTILSLLPASRIGVVCLANVTGGQVFEIALRATDAVVPGFLEAAGKRIERAEAEIAQAYKLTPALAGAWRGTIETESGAIPIALTFRADQSIAVSFGGAETALADARIEDGLIAGSFEGHLALEEASSEPASIELALRLSGDRLYGLATAGFGNARGSFSLPTYISLRKQDAN